MAPSLGRKLDFTGYLPDGWSANPVTGVVAFAFLVAVMLRVGLSGERGVSKPADADGLGEVSHG